MMMNSKIIQVHRDRVTEEKEGEITIKGGQSEAGRGGLQTSAQVTLNNEIDDTSIIYYQCHDWYGQVSAFYPSGISPKTSAEFVHFSDCTNGSKGAVVYSAKINKIECVWLLAWSAPVGTESLPPNNQVYVESGKQEKYKSIDWEVIEGKLNNSSNQSNFVDQITGCTASAEIFTGSNEAAVIAAHFNIAI